MVQGKTIIQSPMGIHARPAASIAACVRGSSCDVIFRCGDIEVDPGNYIKLMSLNAKCGDEIEIIVEGSDEKEVFVELIKVLQSM